MRRLMIICTTAEKYLLALRCLNAAVALDPDFPKVVEQVVAFQTMLDSVSDLEPKVAQVLKKEFRAMNGAKNSREYIEDFQKWHKGSPRHAFAAIAAKRRMGEDKATLDREVVGLLEMKEMAAVDALSILETLQSWRSPEVQAFKKAARVRWPEVTRLA